MPTQRWSTLWGMLWQFDEDERLLRTDKMTVRCIFHHYTAWTSVQFDTVLIQLVAISWTHSSAPCKQSAAQGWTGRELQALTTHQPEKHQRLCRKTEKWRGEEEQLWEKRESKTVKSEAQRRVEGARPCEWNVISAGALWELLEACPGSQFPQKWEIQSQTSEGVGWLVEVTEWFQVSPPMLILITDFFLVIFCVFSWTCVPVLVNFKSTF